jgi:predicted DNA-binding mobile mystery protein A
MNRQKKIIQKQISKRLEEMRQLMTYTSGILSWSKYVREGLGMSLSQLAARMNVSQSTMSETENREIEGRITINKLREIADSLNCDLVYGFVPREKLEDIIYKQAKKVAEETMELASNHMELEDQTVLTSDERLNDIIEDKINSKYLWDKR